MTDKPYPDESPTGKNVERLLDERGSEYGDTWLIAGEMFDFLSSRVSFDKLLRSNYFHNWVLILSKLIRAAFTPDKADHWDDIAGYATLVAKHIRNQDGRRWRQWHKLPEVEHDNAE
jgi:hypothetical protein